MTRAASKKKKSFGSHTTSPSSVLSLCHTRDKLLFQTELLNTPYLLVWEPSAFGLAFEQNSFCEFQWLRWKNRLYSSHKHSNWIPNVSVFYCDHNVNGLCTVWMVLSHMDVCVWLSVCVYIYMCAHIGVRLCLCLYACVCVYCPSDRLYLPLPALSLGCLC